MTNECIYMCVFNSSVYCFLYGLQDMKRTNERTNEEYSAILNYLLRSCENKCIFYGFVAMRFRRQSKFIDAIGEPLIVAYRIFVVGICRCARSITLEHSDSAAPFNSIQLNGIQTFHAHGPIKSSGNLFRKGCTVELN